MYWSLINDIVAVGKGSPDAGSFVRRLLRVIQGHDVASYSELIAETSESHAVLSRKFEKSVSCSSGGLSYLNLSGEEVKELLFSNPEIAATDNVYILRFSHAGPLGIFVVLSFGQESDEEFHHGIIQYVREIYDWSVLSSNLLEVAALDSMTGVYNRHFGWSRLEYEIQSQMRERQPFALVVMDLDHFKSINDTYGHAAGDDALKAAMNAIRHAIRADSILVRYGGEEFVIGLPMCSMDVLSHVIERMRAAIEKIDACKVVPGLKKMTASFGACHVQSSDEMANMAVSDVLRQCFKVADKMAYEAKSKGRNTWCISDLKEQVKHCRSSS